MAILRNTTTVDRFQTVFIAVLRGAYRFGRRSSLRKSISMILAAGIIVAAIPMCTKRPEDALLANPVSDTQVKAAYLYNFAKFTEWPAEAFPDPGSPIVIGVVGPDPFGGTLDQTTNGKTVNGRSISIRRFRLGEDLRSCHILFVSVSDRKQMAAVMLNLNRASVLTVGDMEGFNQEGGIIRFLLEGDRVKFEINVHAAERVQLKLSSKLLSLGKPAKN